MFREFLCCEYSEENILFWTACEDLKTENTPEAIEQKARVIYEDYISILSPKEVIIVAPAHYWRNYTTRGPWQIFSLIIRNYNSTLRLHIYLIK